MKTPKGDDGAAQVDLAALQRELLEQSRLQTRLLQEMRRGSELDPCHLDKIARIACLTANEVHRNSIQLTAMREAIDALLDLYRHVHPDAALAAERIAKLKAQVEACCPPKDLFEAICKYEPCRTVDGLGDGWSTRSRATVQPVRISREPHPAWQIVQRPHHLDDDEMPAVPQGPFVGRITPSAATPNVMDFRSGGGPTPGGMAPVTFRTFTESDVSGGWPPDMSGAKGGGVVLMTGNLWIKLSVDGGASFTSLDFTSIFAADTNYGGWAGDQVVHYVPSIDCFVLYVQSFKSATGPNVNKNVVKVALASPADLRKFAGGRDAWRRQWDFTSDTFGLGASWMDFPDISYGTRFLHLNTNVFDAQPGKLAWELPLADMAAGNALGFLFSFDPGRFGGSPTQNIVNDECYWAEHINNSTLRIYNYNGGDANYAWRECKIDNWPMTTDNDIVSAAPDWGDWCSGDHRIIGAARIGSVLWFAWTAGSGDGGFDGFNFKHPHIRIAQFDLAQDFKLVGQMQVWNPDHAFAYPSLIANANNEMGISLAWGGGKYFGSHAVGILGDFVVWYGLGSTETSLRQEQDDAGKGKTNPDGTPKLYSRWGDYVHVRLAQPDTRFFSAFGYAVLDDPSAVPAEQMRYLYTEFGREAGPPQVIR